MHRLLGLERLRRDPLLAAHAALPSASAIAAVSSSVRSERILVLGALGHQSNDRSALKVADSLQPWDATPEVRRAA